MDNGYDMRCVPTIMMCEHCRCSVDDQNLHTMNYLETEEVPMKHEGQEEERERAIVIVVTCHHIGTRTSWDVGGYAPLHLFCELGNLGFMALAKMITTTNLSNSHSSGYLTSDSALDGV